MNTSSLARSFVESLGAEQQNSRRTIRISWYHFGVVGWSVFDVVCAFVAVVCACALSPAYQFWSGATLADPNFSLIRVAAAYALLFPIIAHVFGLHDPLMRREKVVLWVKYVSVAALGVTLMALLELVFFYTRVGRHILLYSFVLSGLVIPLVRVALWRISEERKRRVMVLGPSEVLERVQELIRTSGIPYIMVSPADFEFHVKAIGTDEAAPARAVNRSQKHCIGSGVDEIVTCSTDDLPADALAELSQAQLSGVQVSYYSSFMERTFFRVPVEQIGPEWFFQLNTSGDYALYHAAKRMADIALAGLGLVLASPLLLFAALLIRLESEGAAFYSQVRVGQFGRTFRIWKLRTMRNDAESNGAQWARENDSRVTRVGWVLRKTRLDEVPQFINVLRGEMSLVGPRPERQEFAKDLANALPFYQHRHLLRPGITGWAQINYRYGATTQDALNKLKYDLYYLKYASPLLDIQILLRTLGAVMKGAR